MQHPLRSRCISRRRFLEVGGAALILPVLRRPRDQEDAATGPLRLGIIADLHWGLAPTAPERLEAFIEEATRRDVDGIVQLGDFSYARPEDQPCLDVWHRFEGPRYHVIGNHDLDFVTKAQVVERWSMPGRYYAFDRAGYHFVVLDRNNLKTGDEFVPYERANFYVDARRRGFADAEQLEWLAADLAATDLPTVLFVHQGFGMTDKVPEDDPQAAILAVVDAANQAGQRPGVVACFGGHQHVDRYHLRRGVHYVLINSASYLWVGEKYGRMAPYRDPLFAFVTFHPDRIEVEGRASEWVSPSPRERGVPDAERFTPSISDRTLEISTG